MFSFKMLYHSYILLQNVNNLVLRCSTANKQMNKQIDKGLMSCHAIFSDLKYLIPSKVLIIINVSKIAHLDRLLHVSI